MTAFIITIHVIVSIALILIVLLQTGKGASMGAVFGGAGSQALFGQTGAATFLGKLTTGAAIVFMLTSLSLAYISKSGGKSVVSDIPAPAPKAAAPAAEKATPDQPKPDTGNKAEKGASATAPVKPETSGDSKPADIPPAPPEETAKPVEAAPTKPAAPTDGGSGKATAPNPTEPANAPTAVAPPTSPPPAQTVNPPEMPVSPPEVPKAQEAPPIKP